MRIHLVEIKGPQGRATIRRVANSAALQVWMRVGQQDQLLDVNSLEKEQHRELAERLHKELEGFEGTTGDLIAYLILLSQMAH